MQLKAFFPRDGSAETPPHPSADFRWKDYCPMAFGKLREVFHIEAAEFMKSICGAPAQPRVAVFHAVFNVRYCHIVCLQRLSRGEC